MMKKEYVEKKNGGYYITDSRVSLDSVVYMFRDGASPETIRQSFSVLKLEEVYGAVTFYLGNQKKIDKYLVDSEKEFELFRKKNHEDLKKNAPELYQRHRRARKLQQECTISDVFDKEKFERLLKQVR